MMEKKKKARFQKYLSAFGIKSVQSRDVIPVSWRAKAEELQRNSIFFNPPLKANMWPVDEKFLLRN